MNFFDFCSGIGGGRLGLEIAGMRCIGHSEIDPNADATYRKFFNDDNNFGDLTKIIPENLPNMDVLIAGFPCQTFSIVGKRRGFSDVRGQIIYYLADILKKKQPSYFILENVKGLVNHDHGRTIKTILDLLDSVGYVVNFKVLNSCDFGVPQMRERVYFVGIRRDLYTNPFVFPDKPKHVKIADFLDENNDDELSIQDSTFQRYLNNKYNRGRVDINKIISTDFNVLDTRQSDLRIYDICPTLRTGRHGILYTRNKKLIKLSGIESLLIQGFTKDFLPKVLGISNKKLLSQTGNAMTVNVIAEIGRALICYDKHGGVDDTE